MVRLTHDWMKWFNFLIELISGIGPILETVKCFFLSKIEDFG